MSDLILKNNANIAIIGGGPAGSFFAILALKEAKLLNKKINITIFDSRNFTHIGPKGCNMCAGVIQSKLRKKLDELGVPLPKEVIQEEIRGYKFFIKELSTLITKENLFLISTVFRGGGPAISDLNLNIKSFDNFLLTEAVKRGATFINSRVKKVETPSQPYMPITLIYGKTQKIFSADLVIGAFGVNSKLNLSSCLPEYRPPETWHTYQAEIFLGKKFIQKKYNNMVHICFIKPKGIKYISATPKGEYVTITAIGKNVKVNDLYLAIANTKIKEYLPKGWNIKCFCHPRIPITSASNPYSSRIIIIGDAAYSRYLKNGIGSAFITAEYAAKAALTKGISKKILKKYYDKPCRKKFTSDNIWGKFLIYIHDIIMTNRILSNAYFNVVINENTPSTVIDKFTGRKLSPILWHLYTGDLPYKKILTQSVHPFLLFRLIIAILKTTFNFLLIPYFKIKSVSSKKNIYNNSYLNNSPTPLKDNSTIAIIGGGPAGTSCAIAILKEAKKIGKKINVIIFEQKNFKHGRHYNQCLGVLSSPFTSILKNELGIELSPKIIIRKIKGYILHSNSTTINLEEKESSDPTYAVRRIELDNFMLENAKKMGVKVISSRATDIEFTPEHVTVYSEGENCNAHVVVGAFGLDDGTCKVFERNTKYRQPEYLNTIVTKMYFEKENMGKIDSYIHAFLPKNKEIEYAAITPKQNHLTINIVGRKVNSLTMLKFLKSKQVQKLFPQRDHRKSSLNFYKGKFPIKQAKNLFGDRYVTIGDAAGLIRPFKGKGINSSYISGILAARSIIHRGVSKFAFLNFYKECDELTADLPYGRILRYLVILGSKFDLIGSFIKLAQKDKNWKNFIFNCVSAQKPYKTSIKDLYSSKTLKDISKIVWKDILNKKKK